jgi:hypothetical protein
VYASGYNTLGVCVEFIMMFVRLRVRMKLWVRMKLQVIKVHVRYTTTIAYTKLIVRARMLQV